MLIHSLLDVCNKILYSLISGQIPTSLIIFFSITITKWNISSVPLNPVADYIHMLDLNTRLRVGWKTLPNLKISNLNFKLKVQTQTWTSKTKISPVLPGNPGFCEIYSMGKRNERNKAMSWLPVEAMSCSRGGPEGFKNSGTSVLFPLRWRREEIIPRYQQG